MIEELAKKTIQVTTSKLEKFNFILSHVFILLTLFAALRVHSQIDTLQHKTLDTEVFEAKHYFNPVTHQNERNVYFSSCWNADRSRQLGHCFYIRTIDRHSSTKVPLNDVEYLNGDSLLMGTGTFRKGRPHGVFKIYCDDFPYCLTVQSTPIQEIFYLNGKLKLDIHFDINGKVKKQRSRQFFWRWTRTWKY